MTTTRQINKYDVNYPPLYRFQIDNHIGLGIKIVIDERLPLDKEMIVDEDAFMAFVLDETGDFIGCKEEKICLTESKCPFMNWPVIWGLSKKYGWLFRDIFVHVSPIFTIKPSEPVYKLLATRQTGRVMWIDEITPTTKDEVEKRFPPRTTGVYTYD